MKLSIIFFTALLTISSCPREQEVKCNKFKLELDKLLFVQDAGQYVSYVGFDSLKTAINYNADCLDGITLDNLNKLFPSLKKSTISNTEYDYSVTIANIKEGEIFKDIDKRSYTLVKFKVDVTNQIIQSFEVGGLFMSIDRVNQPDNKIIKE